MNKLIVSYILTPIGANFAVYNVTLIDHPGQNVTLLPKFFRKVTGVSDRAVLGSLEIDATTALILGFRLPTAITVREEVIA
ncbi:hypothetical protein J2T17_004679 [Paenibacillus mucilaginosus]|uniref:hypothetical protein n=1 Tax=Paenibacillus mucilaginosus TaxID=61624 RepID=UPI003D1D7383